MKKMILGTLLMCAIAAPSAQAWEVKGDKIKTRWTADVSPETAWRSYPRPQLVREEWQSLNGLWSYAVTSQEVAKMPATFDGEILVPYAIESALSGVQRTFLPTDKLWYQRSFTLDKGWSGKSIILHFEAVDYDCTIWLNGRKVGSHKGGNNSFSFDVTKYIKGSGSQTLSLSVTDPTDAESISRGKQQLNQRGIWYTPVSGIWKSVWIEAVGKSYVKQILPTADIAKGSVELNFDMEGAKGGESVKIDIKSGGKVVKSVEYKLAERFSIEIPEAELWTPTNPKLYHFDATVTQSGKVIDRVSSYFALREVKVGRDECGYSRVSLNGENIFQYGTLDQGWWPDGLLTPPTEEAMLWDMVQLKKMGFNTIRKHIKVEPELYYYYADSLGIMIWQDMVSGFATERKDDEQVKVYEKREWNAPEEHSAHWQGELFEMIDRLRFYPSITTWVVFNEGWGQHKTADIVERVMAYDKSRIINGVSGWRDMGVGDMFDVHNYPATSMRPTSLIDGRISVLGEFGGYGWSIAEHIWNPDMRNWGYKTIDGAIPFVENYSRLLYDLKPLIASGLSAAIYTQTTDVEGEVNGLITYDREITKLPISMLHKLHSELYTIEPAKMTTLVPYALGAPEQESVERMLSINGAAPKLCKLPMEFRAKNKVSSVVEFEATDEYESLSLWINVTGFAKVTLNGVVIFDQDTKRTAQASQYNVSDYIYALRKGSNTLEVEAEITLLTQFDFGLTAN